MVGKGIVKTLMNHLKGIYDNYAVKGISEENYEWLKRKDAKNEDVIISLIDEKNMWGSRYTKEKIFPYIDKKRIKFLSMIASGRILFDASGFMGEGGEYIRFREYTAKISGNTLCYKFAGKFEQLIYLSHQSNVLSLSHLLVLEYMLENFLYNHPRIRYGKKELRQLSKKLTELPVMLNRDKEEWEEAQKSTKKNEDDFFKSIVDEKELEEKLRETLKSDLQSNVDRAISLPDIVETIKGQYKNLTRLNIMKPEANADLIHFIKNKLGLKENQLFADYEAYYLIYLIQKKEIQELEDRGQGSKSDKTNGAEDELGWSEKEKPLPMEELKFYMHSYLRYLQMNMEDSFINGRMAEKIAKLGESLLNSEIEADRLVQNEVYDVVSERLQITEEEFEMLF